MNYFTHLFIKRQINSGLLLILVAIAAVIIANSSLAEWYNAFFSNHVALKFGDFNLFAHHKEEMTFHEFINDGLMTVFFFMVGLEIKREIIAGELSTIRQALLPIAAAIGGMIVPVMIFRLISPVHPEANGCAIPMATDIAFAIGVLGLLGDRVPASLKIFLTALAVVDDIGGIIVIALFYSNDIAWNLIMASGVLFGVLYIGNRMHVLSKFFYISIGLVIWVLFVESGIHCTIAGVLVAFFIPARPRIDVGKYLQTIKQNIEELPQYDAIVNGRHTVLSTQQIAILKDIETASDKVISPLQDLEDSLHHFVNFVIMPLFAFVNAGVVFESFTATMLLERVTMSAFFGLVVGKFIGIFTFTWALIRLNVVDMPHGMNWRNLAGVALLGGIGFTVSLFIANLSYSVLPDIGSTLLNQVKIGILGGSLVAGLLGFIYLKSILPTPKEETLNN